MKRIVLSASLLTALVSGASAQISYTTPGATYTETFTNTSGWGTGTSTAVTWTNNSTVAGWYAAYWVNSTGTATTPASYIQSNGTQNGSHSLYIFKDNTDAETRQDGALGAFPVNSQTGGAANAGGVYYGVQFTNNTPVTLTSFTVGYTFEIWRLSSGGSINSLTVSYNIGATSLTSGTWTDIAALTASSPAGPASGTTTGINGNLSANQSVVAPVSVGGVSVAPGQSIWIRWYDLNNSGTDNGIGIDNVTFTAVPEPSAFAAVAGLGVLGAATLRRRRAVRR